MLYVIGNEALLPESKKALIPKDIKVFAGQKAIASGGDGDNRCGADLH